ncbi:hypothetical protein GY45DRAFT_1376512 [Cubamyces sp. BRFM 1775]|nr:hypothetical protein GY45DRAFT_1376512 [Cubamyces sp. BRFM 1775]
MTRGEVSDSFAIRTATTAKVTEACMPLFKCTPEEMAMKIEVYVLTGLSGVVRLTSQKRSTQLKSEIRTKIYEGLCTILREKGIGESDHPPTMMWAQYDELGCRYGVVLEGWTESGDVCNPGDFKLILQLECLHAALHMSMPSCYWVILDDAAWEVKKEARRACLLHTSVSASKRKTARGTDKGATQHADVIEEARIIMPNVPSTPATMTPLTNPGDESTSRQSTAPSPHDAYTLHKGFEFSVEENQYGSNWDRYGTSSSNRSENFDHYSASSSHGATPGGHLSVGHYTNTSFNSYGTCLNDAN